MKKQVRILAGKVWHKQYPTREPETSEYVITECGIRLYKPFFVRREACLRDELCPSCHTVSEMRTAEDVRK